MCSTTTALADVAAIKDEILQRLYVGFFAGQDWLLVKDVQRELAWDERRFWRALEDLSHEGLAKGVDSAPHYEIRPQGILEMEKRGVVPAALRAANNRARAEILRRYASGYEAQGREGDLHYHQVVADVVRDTSLDNALVEANHEFLYKAGQLLHPGSLGYFRIADVALRAFRDWQQRTSLEERFQALQVSAETKERGTQFEQVFGELAHTEGWRVDKNVLGPGEEIDLVLNREDAFYLLECRWRNAPVGAKEIRDFAGKVRKRPAVHGVVVSMSGFTADAKAEVETVTRDTPMVLLGPEEVTDLFKGIKRLNELLADKKRSLVLHRTAPWK